MPAPLPEVPTHEPLVPHGFVVFPGLDDGAKKPVDLYPDAEDDDAGHGGGVKHTLDGEERSPSPVNTKRVKQDVSSVV